MKAMKKIVFLLACVSLFAVVLLLESCDLLSIFGTRILSFESALNMTGLGRAALIASNFHPDMVSILSWNADLLMNGTELRDGYQQFDVTLFGSPTDLGGGVKSQSGTLTSTSPASPQTIEFEFKENGAGNWMILWMRCGGQTWQ